MDMETKYHVLRTIMNIYKIFAVVVLVGGIILGIIAMTTPTLDFEFTTAGELETTRGAPATGSGIGMIVGAIFAALGLFAFAEMIQLFLDMEENTRLANQYLWRMSRSKQGRSHPLAQKEP